MPTLLLLFFTFVCAYLTWFFLDESRKKKSLPPGPPVFPWVGSVISIALADSQPHKAFLKLSEKYGDIMRLRMGPHEYVVLSSMEVLNDILSKDESLGRPNHGMFLDLMEHPNTGLSFANGEPWKAKRSWAVRTFKEMGLGRTSYFEEATRSMISQMHGQLLSDLKQSGNIITVERQTVLCAASMIYTLIVGSNTPEDITDCEEFLHVTDIFAERAAFASGILLMAPFLKHLAPEFTNYNNQMNYARLGRQLGQKHYNKLIKLEGDFPQTFFHSYILEQKKGRKEFFETDFRMTFADILGAAVETTGSYLTSLILFLTLYPQKQNILWEEISNNFPRGHEFTIADLKMMPYTQAFMLEVHRLTIVITNWVPRTLTADVKYKGYTLKKGTTCLPNPHAAYKSPVHFSPDPEAFRPERFIDPSQPSKLTQLRKLVTPFSIGKRACPGESIAEIVSFMILVSTVRNFRLAPVPGETPPTQEFSMGFTAKPKPFRVLMCPRQ